MSGFFGSSEPTRWGGLLKQAISNVETTFDTFMEQNANNMNDTSQARDSHADGSSDSTTETETYMDPISGMVTTIQKPKKPNRSLNNAKSTSSLPSQVHAPSSPKPARQSSDLSARLAAVMAEKTRKPPSRSSSVSSRSTEPTSAQKSVVLNSDENPVSPLKDESDAENVPREKGSIDDAIEDKEEKDAEETRIPVQIDTDTMKDTNNDLTSTAEDSNTRQDSEMPSIATNTVKESTDDDEDNGALHVIANEGNSNDNVVEVKEDNITPDTANERKNDQDNALDENNRILQQRENQLLQAMETITKLHDQLHSAQQDAEKYAMESQEARAEIKDLQTQLAKTQQGRQNTLTNSDQRNIKKLENTIEELKQQLVVKEEKIQGLMQEGEKLSKNELKHNTMIKKLRSEKSEHSKSISELQKKLEKIISDLAEANSKVLKSTEAEKRYQESIKVLSDMTEEQTKHINKLESDVLSLKEKEKQTQIALKAAKDSLEDERNKAKMEFEEAYAAVLEKEVKANDRLHKELTKAKEEAQSMESKLRKEVRDLQIALQTIEERAGTREDTLQQEILELQKRIRMSDVQIEDINHSIEEAASPLLRQIQELQNQHSVAIKNRDLAEQSMITRLQDAENERDKAIRKAEELDSKLAQIITQLETLQLSLGDAQKEKSGLLTQLDTERLAKKDLEEQNEQLRKEKEQRDIEEGKAIEAVKMNYRILLKERMREEKKQWEMKLKAEQANGMKNLEVPPSIAADNNDELGKSGKALHMANDPADNPAISSRSSIDGSHIGITTSSPSAQNVVIERLQANIRQLENQLSFYQTQLQSSSQSRDELSEEMLHMTLEMDKLRNECKAVHELERQHEELNARYQASLELLGERTEQVEELKADVNDVKEMYRNQIVELVQKIDQLSRNR
ncbi:hypothetical protein EC973_003422 [Apophysomyces ossiformis]|uniref:TATA element modulatory factor 1 TATA binding domain-containing protein n=1 Tax=Apophysomyces ossiformis TaxID=679940 RepID=A0A8H7BI24_9FUNG|nr:hypothetical protein EC973_003422 [Apophysomyces ossiformis]